MRDEKSPNKNTNFSIPFEHKQTGDLKVFVFNVGQGDHALIQLADGRYGIIDFYYEGGNSGEMISEPPAITYLKHLNQSDIEIAFICISHTDRDHLKGMDDAFVWLERNKIKIEEVWIPGVMDFGDVVSYLSEKEGGFSQLLQHRFTSPKERHRFEVSYKRLRNITEKYRKSLNYRVRPLGGAIQQWMDERANLGITCVGPLFDTVDQSQKKNYAALVKLVLKLIDEAKTKEGVVDKAKWKTGQQEGANRNDVSSILLFSYQSHQLLFPGDAPQKVLKSSITEIVENGKQYRLDQERLACNFIRAPHHGAGSSSSPKGIWQYLIRKKGKVNIVFSAGKGYHHPHEETYRHMNQANQENDSPAKLNQLKTNQCTGCNQQPASEAIDQIADCDFFNSGAKSKKRTRAIGSLVSNRDQARKRLKNAIKISKRVQLGLLAFLFRMNESNHQNVPVTQLLSRGVRIYEECLFQNTTVCLAKTANS